MKAVTFAFLKKMDSMKTIGLLFLAAAWLTACQQRNSKTAGELEQQAVEEPKTPTDTANFTTIQWIDSIQKDLGTVKEGPEVDIAYKFRNAGKKPLIISNVHASCGCTIPEIPKEPFAPGEEGTIRARFTTQGHLGTNEKAIYVTANTRGSTNQELRFRITVEANK